MGKPSRSMRAPAVRIVLICAWAALAGCGGGDPLDHDTAMNVLRDHSPEPIKTTFSSSPRFDTGDPRIKQAYQELMESHVVECSETAGVGTMCTPGAAGDSLQQEGATELSLAAGQWVPAAIASIQRTGRNSASAEVRMSFEHSELYHDHETAFSNIQSPAATQALSDTKQPKMMHARFERSEDGWHLESLE
jgi:hypothetical protein